MNVMGQSSSRDPSHRKKADTPEVSLCPGSLDLRRTVQVATWNVLTLDRTGHQVALSREMARLGIDTVGLTETRIIDSGRTDVEDSLLLHSGGTTHIHGVALMLRRNCKKALKSWSPISPRLLAARLTHKHGHLSVLVSYAPTEDSPDEDKDLFYDQLESAIMSVPQHDQLILLGDFNAVSGVNRVGFEQVIGNYGSGTPNDNTFRLLTFCAAHGLSILGSWFQRRKIHLSLIHI